MFTFYSSSEGSSTSFVTGCMYTPLGVWIVTTRTSPSLPGMTSLTRARGHLVADVCSPFTQTISPTFKFGEVWRHLLRFCSWPRYSAYQRFHRWRVRAWHRCQRRSRGIVRKEAGGSGRASSGPPTRKSPGVNTSMPSSESRRAVNGLEFKHDSTCARVVFSSTKVRRTPPTTRLR